MFVVGTNRKSRHVRLRSEIRPTADIRDSLGKRPFLAGSPQIAATRLLWPKCVAYWSRALS
jgi:hypothetical protein